MRVWEHYTNSVKRSQKQDLVVLRDKGVNHSGYIVANLDNNSAYNVRIIGNTITYCSCPHHFYRKVPCKHMAEVMKEVPGLEIAEVLLKEKEGEE